ncbi:hypothetical protein N7470_010453 [Penicillium chermesinum]|nr:hypothetical protein N7470_010453 [Penicillium chermesinum]
MVVAANLPPSRPVHKLLCYLDPSRALHPIIFITSFAMSFTSPKLLPTRQLITPPDSPRKRRRTLRDSEETYGELSLESYLLASDPYRSTNLPNPLPYPLCLIPSPALAEAIQPIVQEVFALLRRHGIPDTVTVQAVTLTKPLYPGGDKPFNVLRVEMPSDSPSLHFGPVKDEIIQLLQRNAIQDVYVEIINPTLRQQPSFFFLAGTDTLAVSFQQAKASLITLLDSTSRGAGICYVLLMLEIQNTRHSHPSRLREKMVSLLRNFKLSGQIDVEFVPGDLSLLGNSAVSFMGRMKPTPVMGYSVGIVGQNTAGTLGGWAELTHNGVVHRGFLTNYHVIRPSLSEQYPQSFLKELDRFGATFERPLSRPIHSRKEVITLGTRIEQNEMIGKDTTRLRTILSTRQRQIDDLTWEKNLVQGMPIVLGQVLVTSGASILGKRLMDWAFIELSDEAQKLYFGPNSTFEVPRNQQPSAYWKDLPNIALPVGSTVTDFGNLTKLGYCAKIGRTTEITAGICNGVEAVCRWKGHIRYDHNGQEMILSDNSTEEYIILPKYFSKESTFAEDGDSGSFILNELGEVTGLLFGGASHNASLAGLAMSFEDVITSMKLKLGDSITLSLPA